MSILFVVYFIVAVKITYSILSYFFFANPKVHKTNPTPISVVIAAHNEFENLRNLLPTLSIQSGVSFEVLVVLDRCQDESSSLLNYWNKLDSRIRYLEITEGSAMYSPKKYAIYRGVLASSYDCILCTDADCVPASEYWIKKWSESFTEKTSALIGVGFYKRTGTILSHFIRYETYVTAINYLLFAKLGMPYMGVGRNMAFKKSVFLSLKGYGKYKEIVGGDDDLFIQQIPRNQVGMVLGPASVTYSTPKETWREYWIQKLRHLSVSRHYKSEVKILLGSLSLIQIGFWVIMIVGIFEINSSIVFPLFFTILVTIATHWAVHRSLGDMYDMKYYPLYDLFYTIFVPLVAFSSRIIRNITWK